ncbi:hypothetical protein B0H13DRAFT_2325921 [Mycena leptocephala]|nr:hypothetical protein B0H13DRAFT_2325921 [Mycena leptocephala]
MPPRKIQKRNITGLRNQGKQPPPIQDDPGTVPDDHSMPGVHFDSLRVDWEKDDESDIESELDLDDFEVEDFGFKLVEMAEKEDVKDLDWLPPRLRVVQREKKGGGPTNDPWWETQQLLAQIKNAIRIFEKAHPGKQALFIFDQSSAHASLPTTTILCLYMTWVG